MASLLDESCQGLVIECYPFQGLEVALHGLNHLESIPQFSWTDTFTRSMVSSFAIFILS